MKFTLEIDLIANDNTDQETRDDIQTIMKELSIKLGNPNLMDGKIRNGNGYMIGSWKFEEE